MDTLDRAASLANPQLADSTNKEWLLASACSNSLSASIRLDHSFSSSAYCTNFYGTINDQNRREEIISPPPGVSNWLQRHYASNKTSEKLLHNKVNTVKRDPVNVNYTINNHIYDNISFVDSPILRSLSRKGEDIARNTNEYSCSIGSCNLLAQDNNRMLANNFRHFLAGFVLLGITLAIYSRNALSLAAVGMTANNVMNRELAEMIPTDNQSISALDGACPIPNVTTNLFDQISSTLNQFNQSKSQLELNFHSSIKQKIDRGELVDWTPSQQGLIFAAGSVGNLLIAIPLTRLGEIYGPKWVIFAASFGATVQAAFMPSISPCNVIWVIIFQVIFNGLTYGADCVAYTLFAHWLTPTEMAFFVSCLLICYQLGTILSSFATAKILSENISWSWCFYTPAILCGSWTLIWTLIGASDPTKSKLISNSELHFLLRKSKIAQTMHETSEQNDKRSLAVSNQQSDYPARSVSWLKLAKDPNIWAICAIKFTLRWYFSVYLSLMPTYLSSVAHMSVGTIGKMSVVQSFIGLFSGILMGFLTKSLVNERPFRMSLATTRKFFQSIVNFGLVISLIIFIIYDCDQWVTIITLTFGGICINFYVAAALQLPLDLSPRHCGLITSITNTLALGQALGAPISGLILNDGPKDRSLWRLVWLVAITLNLVSGIIFIILVDSKPRDYCKDQPLILEDENIIDASKRNESTSVKYSQ